MKRTLTVKRETIRQLTDLADLREVNGGITGLVCTIITYFCPTKLCTVGTDTTNPEIPSRVCP
jgi:hypothetical protein